LARLVPDPTWDDDPGGESTECRPSYPRNVVWPFSTSWVYGMPMDGAIDDGPTVLPSDICRELPSVYPSKMADRPEDARERRRRR
jgi:hypothetical protein